MDNSNYESRRMQLKLGPIATCVLIFKTTVGVGIFTFQYAYSLVISHLNKCGFFWGTVLSSTMFAMILFGIQRLLSLCEALEEDRLQLQAAGENFEDVETGNLSEKKPKRVSALAQSVESMPDENLDEDPRSLSAMRRNSVIFDEEPDYQVGTFHRNKNFYVELANTLTGPLKKPFVFFSIVSCIGIGLGFALGNYVYLGILF